MNDRQKTRLELMIGSSERQHAMEFDLLAFFSDPVVPVLADNDQGAAAARAEALPSQPDLLSLLSDSGEPVLDGSISNSGNSATDLQQVGVASARASTSEAVCVPAGPDVLQSAVAIAEDVSSKALCVPSAPKIPSQVGQVGKGRHGGVYEQRLLASHMRMAKLARKTFALGQDVVDLLDGSRFISSAGDIIAVRAGRFSGGLVLQLSKAFKHGNRYKRSITWSEFLEAAYGRFKRNSAVATYLNKGESTIKNMQVFVSGTWMNQQALVLAKLASFARSKRPLVVFKHMKFDETALLCTLNPDKGKTRARSTWQTMVYRLRVVVVWESGENLVLPIVVPPVVMLSTGAAHQYYALCHHPSFQCVNRLIALLQDASEEAFDVLEADGAKSNEKLLAHLYRLANDKKKLMSHARCQNHATQLINVALLTSLDTQALNRLYALTIFLRNLGYWNRMHQALRQWVSESLVFQQDAAHKSEVPSCNPHIQEFVDYP